jgi:hypothetical protein
MLTIWVIGMLIGYVVFKTQRVSTPVLAAIFWPVTGLVLLAGALSNPNSSIRRAIDGTSSPASMPPPPAGSAPVPGAAPAPNEQIARPKYGLIETADNDH